ncbi:MAG: hypothetical protein ACP5E5_06920 [Acidobacteriaceae bacterium]
MPATVAREHHQDRRRALATKRHRGGLELSITASHLANIAQAPGGCAGVPEEITEID